MRPFFLGGRAGHQHHVCRMNVLVPITLLLSPLLALQAIWVVLRVQRLPEAAGPRDGCVGTGPEMRLLILGDSSAAGVGVADQSQALAAKTAVALGDTFRVTWRLKAQTGATARDGLRWLTEMHAENFDAALVVFGVNDCKNGFSRAAWRKNLTGLVQTLRQQNGAKMIVFMAVPPMGHFPLLPHPLRWVLGKRATQFDQDMLDVAAQMNVAFARPELSFDPRRMASDGFHPGAEVYTLCAQAAARAFKTSN